MSNPSPSFLRIPLVEGRRTLPIKDGVVEQPENISKGLMGEVSITYTTHPAGAELMHVEVVPEKEVNLHSHGSPIGTAFDAMMANTTEREKRLLSILRVISALPEASTLSNFDAKQMLDKAIRLALDTLDYEVQRQQAA